VGTGHDWRTVDDRHTAPNEDVFFWFFFWCSDVVLLVFMLHQRSFSLTTSPARVQSEVAGDGARTDLFCFAAGIARDPRDERGCQPPRSRRSVASDRHERAKTAVKLPRRRKSVLGKPLRPPMRRRLELTDRAWHGRWPGRATLVEAADLMEEAFNKSRSACRI